MWKPKKYITKGADKYNTLGNPKSDERGLAPSQIVKIAQLWNPKLKV
jgi:hypothetical protein